jgi:hypothetical protein
MGILDMLLQAAGGAQGAPQFGQIADEAPSGVLARGLSAAFGSDQTPAIGNMVGQLFGQSNGNQQAGMLNMLLGAVGPMAMSGLAGGLLGKMMSPGQTQITPEQAAQLSPQQVEALVNHANDEHPGMADQLGNFYAQHRGLVNTLGGLAATIAMSKMKDHLTSSGQ